MHIINSFNRMNFLEKMDEKGIFSAEKEMADLQITFVVPEAFLAKGSAVIGLSLALGKCFHM